MQPHAERLKTTGATVLSRALEAKGQEVPPEGARFILSLGIRDEDKKRMLDLLARQQQEGLTEEEREALRVQLKQEGDVTMEATELTWADRISLRTRREDIKRLVQFKFGRVSPEVDARVEATETEDGLTALFDRALVAQNEDELLRPRDEAQS